MQNVMIDLETTSLCGRGAIVSIGAVEFSTEGIGRTFYSGPINIAQQVRLGAVIDPATMAWWMLQGQAADECRLALDGNLCISLGEACSEFHIWLENDDEVKIWASDAIVDFATFEHWFAKWSQGTPPYKFYNRRCLRTLRDMYPDVPKPEFFGTKHHALYDATNQAMHAIALMKEHAK